MRDRNEDSGVSKSIPELEEEFKQTVRQIELVMLACAVLCTAILAGGTWIAGTIAGAW